MRGGTGQPTWLVTGGAGYIGAHVATDLLSAGYGVVVVDNFSSGRAERIPDACTVVQADVRDSRALYDAITDSNVSGIVHLAARKDVEESGLDPLRYYRENLDGTRSVLAAMTRTSVRNIVFSSSAAVYGSPSKPLVNETDSTRPENAYGRTKLVSEWMLQDAARAHDLRYVSLRYFNVAGAGRPHLGDCGVSNLLPRLLQAVATDTEATVFGANYRTPDGSCVRDYVHVQDISTAHLRAIESLESGAVDRDVFNVGCGTGVSVLEMIDTVGRVVGRPLRYRIADRRNGDPARVVASVERIAVKIGWRHAFDLTAIVSSAWTAAQRLDLQLR